MYNMSFIELEKVGKYFFGQFQVENGQLSSQNLGACTTENLQPKYIALTSGTYGFVFTFFTKTGNNFIRTATTVKKENGEYAVDSILDPASDAYKNLINGLPYAGNSLLYGVPYFERYTPIFQPNTTEIIGASCVMSNLGVITADPLTVTLQNNTYLISLITGSVKTGVDVLLTQNQGSLTTLNYQNIIELFQVVNFYNSWTLFTRSGDEFIRTATLITDETGKYAIGTTLEHDSPAYKLLLNGDSYNGETILYSYVYFSSYVPVFDSFTGLVIGAYFAGHKI